LREDVADQCNDTAPSWNLGTGTWHVVKEGALGWRRNLSWEKEGEKEQPEPWQLTPIPRSSGEGGFPGARTEFGLRKDPRETKLGRPGAGRKKEGVGTQTGPPCRTAPLTGPCIGTLECQISIRKESSTIRSFLKGKERKEKTPLKKSPSWKQLGWRSLYGESR